MTTGPLQRSPTFVEKVLLAKGPLPSHTKPQTPGTCSPLERFLCAMPCSFVCLCVCVVWSRFGRARFCSMPNTEIPRSPQDLRAQQFLLTDLWTDCLLVLPCSAPSELQCPTTRAAVLSISNGLMPKLLRTPRSSRKRPRGAGGSRWPA